MYPCVQTLPSTACAERLAFFDCNLLRVVHTFPAALQLTETAVWQLCSNQTQQAQQLRHVLGQGQAVQKHSSDASLHAVMLDLSSPLTGLLERERCP